jgi:hypothetical protein
MATRADDNGPFKEFAFEDWLRERFREVRQEMKGRKEKFNTTGFRTHLRNASKEQLLAVRSLIDSAIEYIDRQEAGSKKV